MTERGEERTDREVSLTLLLFMPQDLGMFRCSRKKQPQPQQHALWLSGHQSNISVACLHRMLSEDWRHYYNKPQGPEGSLFDTFIVGWDVVGIKTSALRNGRLKKCIHSHTIPPWGVEWGSSNVL